MNKPRSFEKIWNDTPDLNKKIWLDAGCGAGTYTRFIAQQGVDIVGFDYSFLSIQKAKSKSDDPITWCVGDINKIPLKPHTFDGAICFGVTQAPDNSGGAVQSLTKIIKPGGYVYIDALNDRCLPHICEQFTRRILNRPIHLRYENQRNLSDLMRHDGLTDIQIYWLPDPADTLVSIPVDRRNPRCKMDLASHPDLWLIIVSCIYFMWKTTPG
jgi:ubiquinone/menaquinone biosynthesis C-methylase UbiE